MCGEVSPGGTEGRKHKAVLLTSGRMKSLNAACDKQQYMYKPCMGTLYLQHFTYTGKQK